jgi:hypothetical protein
VDRRLGRDSVAFLCHSGEQERERTAVALRRRSDPDRLACHAWMLAETRGEARPATLQSGVKNALRNDDFLVPGLLFYLDGKLLAGGHMHSLTGKAMLGAVLLCVSGCD